jgi:hypothetical protein
LENCRINPNNEIGIKTQHYCRRYCLLRAAAAAAADVTSCYSYS